MVLLFVPRSGSTYLACLLAQTGLMGFPLEYFAPDNLLMLSKRLRGLTADSIRPLFRVRTSPNGVFSFKWNGDFQRMTYGPAIRAQLHPNYTIIIDREAHLAQAQSYARVLRTSEWIKLKGQTLDVANIPEPGSAEVSEAERVLEVKRAELESIASEFKVPTMRIMYEQLLDEPIGIIQTVLKFCGQGASVEVDPSKVPVVRQSR